MFTFKTICLYRSIFTRFFIQQGISIHHMHSQLCESNFRISVYVRRSRRRFDVILVKKASTLLFINFSFIKAILDYQRKSKAFMFLPFGLLFFFLIKRQLTFFPICFPSLINYPYKNIELHAYVTYNSNLINLNFIWKNVLYFSP